MEVVTTVFVLAIFVCFAAIIKPFKPFGRRRNAVFATIACFLLVGLVAPTTVDPETGKTADAGGSKKKVRETIPREQVETNLAKIDTLIADRKYLDANEELIQTGYRVMDQDREFFNQARDEIKSRMATNILEKVEIDRSDPEASIKNFEDAYGAAIQYADRDVVQNLFEPKVSSFVRGLPASQLKENEAGYRLLSRINPANNSYSVSAQKYRDKQIESLLGAFRLKHDKIQNTTFYTHRNAPAYVNSRSTVYLYIGKSGSSEWLRMKTIYTADNWLFVDRVIAYADGVTETLTAGRFDRDHSSGDIWEWLDENPSDSQIRTLRMLANADDATLRYEGSQYRRDVQISSRDKRVILETLDAFERLKAE